MAKHSETASDPEIVAIAAVDRALRGLQSEAQSRVLRYIAGKLNIDLSLPGTDTPDTFEAAREAPPQPQGGHQQAWDQGADGALEGISPVARKWMARNNLNPKDLSRAFSLGVDEIDLIAKNVPGTSKRDRMHSVLLLKGIAAYLGSGTPRFTYAQVKEACLHYKAYDPANFAKNLKDFSSEVSGEKSSGYSLTPRGLTEATEKLKAMLQAADLN